MKYVILMFAAISLMASCYRMPTDEDYCVVPVTNNPELIRAKPVSAAPSINY